MNRGVLRFVWYRFRATFGLRWGGYLTVAILVGLLGGLAMGAVAAGRRTQSAFSAFLARTNASDLKFGTAVYAPGLGSNAGYDQALIDRIAHLPHVRRVESAALLDVVPFSGPNGTPSANDPVNVLNTLGSVDAEYFDEDRVTITKGRMADPGRVDEIVVQASAVEPTASVRVGQVIPLGVYSNAEEARPGFSPIRDPPVLRIDAKVVGIGASNDNVVADAVDSGGTFLALFTPAFTRSLLNCCARATPETAIQVDGGRRGVAAVEAEIGLLFPKGFPLSFYVTSDTAAKADRAIKPEAIALGVFGGIAGLAALLIAGQAIGRQLRLGADDLSVLRALGASPAMTINDGLLGVGGAAIVGALVAVAVAVGMSPLAPIGPVRQVDRSPGVALDWTIVGFGPLVLIAALAGVTLALAYRQAPHRAAKRRQVLADRGSSLARVAAASGLPAPAVAGIRFAVDAGSGRNAVPVRSTIVGVSMAVIVVTATLSFGASLHTLVSHPALYGWNWNYELDAGGGASNIPQAQAAQLLDRDRDVLAWSGAYFATLYVDGQLVPVLGQSPGAVVAPPVLSGHSFDSPGQVVLGALTLAQLHKRVGETVVVTNGIDAPTRLQIVGTAAMPAIGSNFSQHLTMGTGAVLSYTLIPAFLRDPSGDPVTGPNAILVRLRHAAPVSSLQTIANATSSTAGGGVSVVAVQRPAEIINYRSMGTTPALLGTALAAGAVIALGLTLVSSVRRRRRDLALLKALGFTRRQVAAAVAWQSTIAVAIGTVVGIPLGIALGRSLWTLFAHEIHVVSVPTVSVVSLLVIAGCAFVLANIVAYLPGRAAAATPAALLLRAE